MTTEAASSSNPAHFIAAFGTGGLLTLMVHFNGELAHYGNALFASWTAHGTGTVAAIILLLIFYRGRISNRVKASGAPLWAYLGGLSGAATVILTSTTVNSPLALSGTLALGLAGQVVFSVAADRWGLFGLPKRRPDVRDMAALGLVISGSALIILFGRGGV
ncbi:DMT family transporter [Phyllobacterium myrsinacearum]|uniref:Transporter family-2 protein n=1 Tax=Phyllobacterium myrsinacearum TaxID=28101 RepID=A0A839EPB0_9HYPH|nr:DMT family transporter [Phyllobacterium myrsinacearum]MBA8880068.1 transporter family-2 protein [Phyllobacterium myrsinacearum]